MKACKVSRGIDPFILNLGTMWTWVVDFTIPLPQSLYPGKEPPMPVMYEAGLAPEAVWIFWKRKISCNCPDSMAQPVAQSLLPLRYASLTYITNFIWNSTSTAYWRYCVIWGTNLLMLFRVAIAISKIIKHTYMYWGQEPANLGSYMTYSHDAHLSGFMGTPSPSPFRRREENLWKS
jgi:hypothetical protein